ncbi:helix-turn-helix domain-containing protein [Streptomyces sp. NPDC056061]|uniref:helix-turn-helix domain-containing protein n=1 Tax=Streptomyces sp. NPDC056061 TaxID=3345700 RepID=UPI0035D69055
MRTHAPNWGSPRARALIDAGDVGGLIRWARTELGWRQADLGKATGYSASAVSRLETGHRSATDLDMIRNFAQVLFIPASALAAVLRVTPASRHENRVATAQRVTLHAAAKVDAAGLNTPVQAATFAQMLCTVAYAAALADDRDRALEMISEAERAVKLLPGQQESPQTFSVTPASVALYKVGVLWGLGDAGAAVRAGRNLHPGQFPTAERRGRLHTDMARAWWQWGKPEETAVALLSAHREAPAEVRDRPSMRALVAELTERHPRTSTVRQLAAAVHTRSV